MQPLRFQRKRILQSLHQRHVLGDVVVLAPNPLRSPNRPRLGAIHDYADAGRPGLPWEPLTMYATKSHRNKSDR